MPAANNGNTFYWFFNPAGFIGHLNKLMAPGIGGQTKGLNPMTAVGHF